MPSLLLDGPRATPDQLVDDDVIIVTAANCRQDRHQGPKRQGPTDGLTTPDSWPNKRFVRRQACPLQGHHTANPSASSRSPMPKRGSWLRPDWPARPAAPPNPLPQPSGKVVQRDQNLIAATAAAPPRPFAVESSSAAAARATF